MNSVFFTVFIFIEESAASLIQSPNQTAVEPTIINLVSWLKLLIETTGAAIIAIGIVRAIIAFTRALLSGKPEAFTKIRLLLARYLALALEFQLGADILSTAISPSWDQIGKLGAIAVIRTALNYFLSREMKEEPHITDAELDQTKQSETPA